MELFDFIKIIFVDPEKYSAITPGEKRKQYSMINRRFSIQYPMQANALQHLKINQAAVVDFWQNFLRKQYRQLPGWIYTKGVKKLQETKEKKQNVSNELINEYSKTFKIDRKSIVESLEFFPDETLKELKAFEKIYKEK